MLMKGKLYCRNIETIHHSGAREGLPLNMKLITLEVRDFTSLSEEEIDALTDDDIFTVSFAVNEDDPRAWTAFANVKDGQFYAVNCERMTTDGVYLNCVNPAVVALSKPVYLAPSKIVVIDRVAKTVQASNEEKL